MVIDPSVKTLAGILDRTADHADSSACIIWNDEKFPYHALRDSSKRVAGGLAAMGIRRGDHVAISMPNCADWLLMFFACARLGAAVVVMNTKLAVEELADLIERADVKALVYQAVPAESQIGPASNPLRMLGADKLKIPNLRLLVAVDGGDHAPAIEGVAATTSAALLEHAPLEQDQADPRDVALIYSTSGSTGVSKLVMHSHLAMATHVQDVVANLGLHAPETVHFMPLPLAGAYGLTQTLIGIASARPIVMQTKFEAIEAVALMKRHRVTNLYLFDEVITQILDAAGDEQHPFPALRLCTFGIFNPAAHDFIDRTEARGIKLLGLYGSSEIQAFFVVQKPDATRELRTRTGGFPVSSEARMRIRDINTGELLGPGLSGEIEVSGPSVMMGYFGNAVANQQLLPDGFFRTGDTGFIDQDGSVVFESRSDDVLRLSGYLVLTKEIEAAILRSPGVSACNVVGIRTGEGNRPVAFVTMAEGASFDAQNLKADCAQRLARYKVPVAFHLLDSFPLVGSLNAPKVDKKKLREMAAELSGA